MASRIRLPADVELVDRLAFGLTARQLVILAATALASYATYATVASAAPPALGAAAATPLAVAGIGLAFGRRDGLSGDRFALAAARFLALPRRRVLAPEGLPPRLEGAPAGPRVSPLDVPVRAVLRSGVIERSDGGYCVLLRASGTSFALKSDEEQAALAEGFGRYLNGLVDPVAIVVRGEPVDLTAHSARLRDAADGLGDPALRDAALAHAGFLAELGAQETLRRRDITLVICCRSQDRAAATATLTRRCEETATLLRAAGVTVERLDGPQAAALLGQTVAPPGFPAGAAPSQEAIRRC